MKQWLFEYNNCMISNLMFHTMVIYQLVGHPDLKESYFFNAKFNTYVG